MATIKNARPLSPEKLFDFLKTGFADYINSELDSNLAIEYAHVFNEINVSFPEVIDGPALNIAVTDVELTVTLLAAESNYNAELLEENLIGFLEQQAT
ncbi:hypothetical protein [Mucilaginibacter agri]|uniref:Uncharacterized protein n=1 Tax=Mucilaginibacter agri TaxID=2695265 RepID=A0A966DS26_9SPHI|nr:hypothetical protein [Mucilaginibacter agri]NCD69130.1 hypothetical protein [Mucilaginibacter agri]